MVLSGSSDPPSEECSENYEKFENMCIRVSPHALDWRSAEKQCIHEGGHLLHILTEEAQSKVEFLIRSKLRSKSHFEIDKFSTGLSSSSKEFWIGGAVFNQNQWKWIGNRMNFSNFYKSTETLKELAVTLTAMIFMF